MNGTHPIRVVFLLFYYEAWDALEPIYRAMSESDDFEPIVVTLSRKLTGDEGYGGEPDVHSFLEQADIAHVRLRGDDHGRNFERLKSLEPDYVFLNYPWQRNYPPAFRPDRLVTFTRIAYVPYFLLPLVDEQVTQTVSTPRIDNSEAVGSFTSPVAAYLYQQRAHQLASLVFVQDEATKQAFGKTERGNSHVFVTGSPKLDVMRAEAERVTRKARTKAKKKKSQGKYDLKVLWAPHHSYSPAWLNFGRFKLDYIEMLSFASENPRIKVTLRPHPFLFGTLVDRGVLAAEDLKKWQISWRSLPNTRIASKKSFVKQFIKHDILLTDGISFLAEYPLVTSKPAIFIENAGHWRFNELGELAASCNVRVNNVAEFAALANHELTAKTSQLGAATAEQAQKVSLEHSNRIANLKQRVDPYAGVIGKTIATIVRDDFETGPSLVDPSTIKEVPWEDQPGREPRTD